MKKYLKVEYIILLIGIVCILEFMFISRYNHPSADDYHYHAWRVEHQGFVWSNIWHFFHWGGRYFANFFALLAPLEVGNFTVYKIYPVFIILLTWLSLVYFSKTILPSKASNKNSIVMSIFLMLMYLAYMPMVTEGFYWYTGSVTYQFSACFLVFLVAFLIRFIRKEGNIYWFLSLLMLIFINGSNETVLVLVNISLLILIGIRYYLYKKIDVGILTLFFISNYFGIIAFLAPGNFERTKTISAHKFDFLFALKGSILFTIKTLLLWLVESIPFIAIFIALSEKYKIKSLYPTRKGILISVAIIIITFYISAIPSFFAQGSEPPGRALNVLYLFFIILVLNLSLQIKELYFNEKKYSKILNLTAILIAIVIIGINVFSQKNTNMLSELNSPIKEVFHDELSGEAKLFDQQMNERYTLLKKSEGRDVTVPAIIHRPKTICYDYVDKTDTTHWVNVAIAKYFKLKSIKSE